MLRIKTFRQLFESEKPEVPKKWAILRITYADHGEIVKGPKVLIPLHNPLDGYKILDTAGMDNNETVQWIMHLEDSIRTKYGLGPYTLRQLRDPEISNELNTLYQKEYGSENTYIDLTFSPVPKHLQDIMSGAILFNLLG